MQIGSLCSGYGGLDLAVLDVFPDAQIAWFAETDEGASAVLAHHYPDIPNLGDITKVSWGGDEHGSLAVDMLTAGFPCLMPGCIVYRNPGGAPGRNPYGTVARGSQGY